MKQKKNLYILIIAFMLFAGMIPANHAIADEEKEVVGIGVLTDGPESGEFVALLRKELEQLLAQHYEVSISEKNILRGDWTRETVGRNLDRLLNDPAIDVVIAADAIASHEVCRRTELSKPVIATHILDRDMQQLPYHEGGSGVHNLSYLLSIPKVESGIARFLDMAKFNKMALLVSRHYYEAIPELRDYIAHKQHANTENFSVTMIPVGEHVNDALAALPQELQAVYLTPLPQFSEQEKANLIAGLNARKLLSFSHAGKDDVEAGVLAAIAPKWDLQRLVRRVAINVERTLMEEDPANFTVAFWKESDARLVLNMKTARNIGFSPDFRITMEAELLYEEPEAEDNTIYPTLSLAEAVREALKVNLDIARKRQDVIVGQEDVGIARADRLPKIDLSMLGKTIDSDRAGGMSGQVERDLSGSVTLTQVLYSYSVNTGIEIQERLQDLKKQELEQLQLDIIQDTANAYLNVLRAKTYESIQRENLKVTKSNLEQARSRKAIGSSGPGEVYRWESSLATGYQELMKAQNTRKQAEIQLNRILHRSQEERFLTVGLSIDDPSLITGSTPLLTYISNPRIFELFRDFMVQKGLEDAPELAQIDAAIAAQELQIAFRAREYKIPVAALQGEASYIFAKGGEGSEESDTSQLPATLAPLFENDRDDFNWSLGLKISLPLFSGGAKRREFRQAKLELERLYIQRQGVCEKLEQQIRSALFQTGNSYARIGLAHSASASAGKTLELVRDSYSRGLASILDVIDAQNAALVSALLVADSEYNFLLDLMKSERAINRFDFFLTPEEQQRFFREFESYVEYHGLSL